MPWKIRIKHADGRVAVDLPVRTQENPLVIGRVAECDIEIPTTSVSRQHCLIYVQGDAWVVKDAASRAGTYVNGSKIVRPTIVEANDVITLGEDENAPSLTMVYIAPADEATAAVAAREPAEAGTSEHLDTVATDEDAAAFDAEQIGGIHTRRYYVPKGKGMSGGVITALIIVTVVLIGGGGLAWYKLQEKREQSAVKPAAPPPAPVVAPPVDLPPAPPPSAIMNEKGRVNVFVDESARKPAPATAPQVVGTIERRTVVDPAAPATPAKPEGEEAPAEAVDPRRTSDAWQRVEHARRAARPGESLFIYESYRIDNPAGPFLDEVAAFTEESFDLLWWYRCRDLLSQAETLRQQIVKLDGDIRIESDAAYKKKLQAERQSLSEQLLTSQSTLKEMNYTLPDPPDVYDPAKLAELRKTRDQAYYEKWKKKAMATIKYSRGVRAF